MFTTDSNLKISNKLKNKANNGNQRISTFLNYADFYIEIDQKPRKMGSEIF